MACRTCGGLLPQLHPRLVSCIRLSDSSIAPRTGCHAARRSEADALQPLIGRAPLVCAPRTPDGYAYTEPYYRCAGRQPEIDKPSHEILP